MQTCQRIIIALLHTKLMVCKQYRVIKKSPESRSYIAMFALWTKNALGAVIDDSFWITIILIYNIHLLQTSHVLASHHHSSTILNAPFSSGPGARLRVCHIRTGPPKLLYGAALFLSVPFRFVWRGSRCFPYCLDCFCFTIIITMWGAWIQRSAQCAPSLSSFRYVLFAS